MKVHGKNMRSLWYDEGVLYFIDQRKLPKALELFSATTEHDVAIAIRDMVVRGAPAIGCAAAYGVALASDHVAAAYLLKETRPTAHDLFYAIDHMVTQIELGGDPIELAETYTDQVIDTCRRIGEHGASLITHNARVLTHCNAGALATVDYGTALAPIRVAQSQDPFIWVDETRPRLQGLLTAWELEQESIDHAVIADNAAGYFMKKGDVDIVIVGADRITSEYDVANKIGTYEKAVLARDNNIPFYVAAPKSTFDPSIANGNDIVIEERSTEELTTLYPYIPRKIRNPAFDITPHHYITGIITEDGITKLS